MKRSVPSSFVAVRSMTIEGTVYDRGATIPVAVAKRMRGLAALVSRGWIKATPDVLDRSRRGGARLAQPTYYSPRELAAIVVA